MMADYSFSGWTIPLTHHQDTFTRFLKWMNCGFHDPAEELTKLVIALVPEALIMSDQEHKLPTPPCGVGGHGGNPCRYSGWAAAGLWYIRDKKYTSSWLSNSYLSQNIQIYPCVINLLWYILLLFFNS